MQFHEDRPATRHLRIVGATPGRIVRFPRARPPRVAPADLLHELFEARVDERFSAPAVAAGRRTVTYLELDRYANRVARHLWARGVRRGSRVAILLRRSATAYGAILGVLKSGAACIPLEPSEPPDRVEYVLEDSGATALLTTSALGRRHGGFRGQVVLVDSDRKLIAAESRARLPRDLVRVDPNDLCHVTYDFDLDRTPKGVMIEHRSACHLARVAERTFGVRPWDRVYQGSPLHADGSIQEIWLAFHAGATLVAPTARMERAAGRSLCNRLAKAQVTVLSCTPSRLATLPREVPSIRLLILRGGEVSDQLVARWARADRRLVNTYGRAESTVMTTYADLQPGRPVTVGRPFPGCRVYVVDEDLGFVRCGRIGEICIGGAGVARGYLGLPAETSARFVQDPFASGGSDARMYRTGDLGRIDASGNLEYHGRAAGWRSDARLPDGSLS